MLPPPRLAEIRSQEDASLSRGASAPYPAPPSLGVSPSQACAGGAGLCVFGGKTLHSPATSKPVTSQLASLLLLRLVPHAHGSEETLL